MSATTTENRYVLERLAIDQRLVRFQSAVAVIEPRDGELRWWIAVFDAQAGDLDELRPEVDVRASTSRGTRLAGRALTDCITPACRFVGLRGVGPLRIG